MNVDVKRDKFLPSHALSECVIMLTEISMLYRQRIRYLCVIEPHHDVEKLLKRFLENLKVGRNGYLVVKSFVFSSSLFRGFSKAFPSKPSYRNF